MKQTSSPIMKCFKGPLIGTDLHCKLFTSLHTGQLQTTVLLDQWKILCGWCGTIKATYKVKLLCSQSSLLKGIPLDPTHVQE